MADQKRIWRLGIDVGGTNTDAVVIDGDLKLVAATKSPTTEDVMSGIVAAMHEVITQIGADAARNIGFAMLGTTHCTNAIVERKRLNKVAALRVGAPATTAISCMADWPDELKNAMRVRDFLVHGGNEFDGREISALSEDEIREVARVVREEGFESVAVTSVFSPVSDAHEKRAAAVLREELGEGFPITLSSEIGSLGFLERENASILNAALYDVARTTADSFEAALASEGLADVAVYLGQNDGTLMSVDYAKRYPIFTIACGPTNSIRGASFLTQEKDAVVVDIGGTTTDIALFVQGSPVIDRGGMCLGGRRTLVPALATLSIGVGGDSRISVEGQGASASVEVGPLRSGPAMAFGGKEPTFLDALNVLNSDGTDRKAGNADASERAMAALAARCGLETGDLALRVWKRAVQKISDAAAGLLAGINAHPIYTLRELKSHRDVSADRVYLVGGPTDCLARRLSASLGLPVVPTAEADVANAVGAALTSPTSSLEIYADTGKGELLAPSLDLREPLENGYSLESVSERACSLLREHLRSEGVEDVPVEVTEADMFATLDDRGYGSKDIRVTCQAVPGILARVHTEKA